MSLFQSQRKARTEGGGGRNLLNSFFFFKLLKVLLSVFFLGGGHTMQHAGFQFSHQGSNLCPLHWERRV